MKKSYVIAIVTNASYSTELSFYTAFEDMSEQMQQETNPDHKDYEYGKRYANGIFGGIKGATKYESEDEAIKNVGIAQEAHKLSRLNSYVGHYMIFPVVS